MALHHWFTSARPVLDICPARHLPSANRADSARAKEAGAGEDQHPAHDQPNGQAHGREYEEGEGGWESGKTESGKASK
jgi:hypothetical protein